MRVVVPKDKRERYNETNPKNRTQRNLADEHDEKRRNTTRVCRRH